MEIPTEDQIKAAIDELEVNSTLNHEHGNKEGGECDVCLFCRIITERGKEKNAPTFLDQLVLTEISIHPPLALMATLSTDVLNTVLKAAYLSFLIGLKVGKNSQSTTELEKMAES